MTPDKETEHRMFTGLVDDVGLIEHVADTAAGRELRLEAECSAVGRALRGGSVGLAGPAARHGVSSGTWLDSLGRATSAP